MASIQITNISASGRSTTQLIVGTSITFRGDHYYTALDLIRKRGLKDPKVPTVAQYRRKFTGKTQRAYPHPVTFLAIQHADKANLVANDDGEWSSTRTTAWYVAEYCRINHLKEC